jgi:hypothetical protein
MATRREDIESMITKTMEGREIAASVPPESPETAGDAAKVKRFSPPPKRQIQVRFDPGDYETLQRIAYRKGTKAAALVREAVKDLIRREEGAAPAVP